MKITGNKLLLAIAAIGVSLSSYNIQAQQCDGSTNDYDLTLAVVPLLPSTTSCQFNYTVSPGKKQLNKISFLEFAIDCSLTATGPNLTQRACGAGGQGGAYAFGLPFSVITYTPQPGALNPIEMTVDTCNVGTIGFSSKAGPSVDACTTDGPVPGFIGEGASTASACYNLTKEVEIDDPENPGETITQVLEISLKVTRSPINNCITEMEYHNGHNCEDPNPMPVPAGTPDPANASAGSLDSQICPESVSGDTGSPFYGYEINSGGTPYKLCIDLANGSLVPLNNCPNL